MRGDNQKIDERLLLPVGVIPASVGVTSSKTRAFKCCYLRILVSLVSQTLGEGILWMPSSTVAGGAGSCPLDTGDGPCPELVTTS